MKLRGAIISIAVGMVVVPSLRAAPEDTWVQAITKRDVRAVENLVAAGADVNRANRDGQTALMLAAAERKRSLMQLLLDRGAHVDARNNRGGTALMYSATAGDLEGVKLMLARGANVNARAANGWTALTLAAARGFPEVVAVLLASGGDPNVQDIYGWTPLMRAVQQMRPGVVRVLVTSKRVALDAQNENGLTALHLAAGDGLKEIALMLVERGADIHVRDRAGRTPAAVAAAEGHPEIAKIIDGANQE